MDVTPHRRAPVRDREADERVLRAVLDGTPDAFDRFVDHFGNRIYAFGIRMCGQREDAEDVFQETLFTAYRKIQTVREPKALSTWLYRVVANACLVRRRRSVFAPEEELSLDALLPEGGVAHDGPMLPSESDPANDLYRKELAGEVEKAVRDLPADYRIVWVMRDVEGLDTAETAFALGITEGNVKMRLHRARLVLRQRLAHLGPREA
jgi:RNA polymerase sigma-70 factor (ECF subfamily)